MQLGKAVLKAELAQSLAKKLEDVEEKAKRETAQFEGGIEALRQAAAALNTHRAYYQDRCDAGKLDGPQTKVAMDVISRCIGGLQSLTDKATLARSLKQGELQGVRRSIDLMEREYRAEIAKVQAIENMIEQDGRPHNAAAEDLARRKEAARAEKAAMAAKKGKKKATKKKTTKAKKKSKAKKTKA